MVNAVNQIDEYLNHGANALEVDVTFHDDGTPKKFYHGIPCDIGRNCIRWANIANYINAIRERTIPNSRKFNSRLVLIMFDVKLTRLDKGVLLDASKKFADTIMIPLYKDNPTKMKVMISAPNFTLEDFISGVLSQLNAKQPGIVEKIGFEISFDKKVNTPYEKEQAFRRLGVAPGHAWLSSGASNIVPFLFLNKLKDQVRYRDSGNYFSKVYAWTLDYKSTAVKYLSINLDGVIANDPDRVNKAIDEVNKESSAGKKVRLATLDDNPFKVY